MPEMIRDFWSQILLAAALLIGYGRKSQQFKDLKNDFDKHVKKIEEANYLNLPDHDRIQNSCRTEWKNEFHHMRSEIKSIREIEFVFIKESLTRLEDEFSKLRDRQ